MEDVHEQQDVFVAVAVMRGIAPTVTLRLDERATEAGLDALTWQSQEHLFVAVAC